MPGMKIVILGASGYVGSRLTAALLDKGYQVRVIARRRENLTARVWAGDPNVEIMPLDMLDPMASEQACQGCAAAFYLIHSLNSGSKDFAAADRQASRQLVDGASRVGLKRIIYLGSLSGDDDMCPYFRSRKEVGDILLSGKVPTTVLRSGMIMGTGSASFEILRYLVERSPFILATRAVHTKTQPIAIQNVLSYLIGCLEHPLTVGKTFDLGGPDVVTYSDLLTICAEESGVKPRVIIPVPFLTSSLCASIIRLVTPVPFGLISPLIAGLHNRLVCENLDIQRLIPQKLITCREAIRRVFGHSSGRTGTDRFPPPENYYEGDPSWVHAPVRR